MTRARNHEPNPRNQIDTKPLETKACAEFSSVDDAPSATVFAEANGASEAFFAGPVAMPGGAEGVAPATPG